MIRHKYRVTRDRLRPAGGRLPTALTVRPPTPDDRLALVDDGDIVAAVLNSTWDDVAMVGYVMTRAAWKGQGIGSALVDLAVTAMLDDGFDEVTAWITEGNTPSETIFTRAGFKVVDTIDTDS